VGDAEWMVEKRLMVPVEGRKLFEGSSEQRRSSIAWPWGISGGMEGQVRVGLGWLGRGGRRGALLKRRRFVRLLHRLLLFPP